MDENLSASPDDTESLTPDCPTGPLRQTAERVLIIAAVILLLSLAAGLFLSPRKLAYTVGLILGGGVFAARILLLRSAIIKEASMEPDEAGNHARVSVAYRYFLTMAAMAVITVVPFVDVIGGCVGLLLPNAALYIARAGLGLPKKGLPKTALPEKGGVV